MYELELGYIFLWEFSALSVGSILTIYKIGVIISHKSICGLLFLKVDPPLDKKMNHGFATMKSRLCTFLGTACHMNNPRPNHGIRRIYRQ